MSEQQYDFNRDTIDILKERWHALEVEQPTDTDSNELESYEDIELDLRYTNDEYMMARYSTEYLLELTEALHSHYEQNIDVSLQIHLYRMVLSHFEPFGRMMTFLELKYGDAAFTFNEAESGLGIAEEKERSQIVKECIAEYIRMMPDLNTWIIDVPGLSIQELFLLLLVVFVKMIELELFVTMLIDDEYENEYDDDEYEDE